MTNKTYLLRKFILSPLTLFWIMGDSSQCLMVFGERQGTSWKGRQFEGINVAREPCGHIRLFNNFVFHLRMSSRLSADWLYIFTSTIHLLSLRLTTFNDNLPFRGVLHLGGIVDHFVSNNSDISLQS